MKQLAFFLLALFLTCQAYGQQTNDNDTVISNNPAKLKLKVLYFHITNRCTTCRGIEAKVRKTLDEQFKNEVETGVIDFYVMNCELPENQELVKKYDAYGATLALTSMQNGKEQRTEDLTNWAFQKTHDPELFIEELTTKIKNYLN